MNAQWRWWWPTGGTLVPRLGKATMDMARRASAAVQFRCWSFGTRQMGFFARFFGGDEKVTSRREQVEQRKAIIRAQLKKGYFADMEEFRVTRGKRYTAPSILIPVTCFPV